MRFKKSSYVLMGFLMGLVVASVFAVKEVKAQWGDAFTEDKLLPMVPQDFGSFVCASGQDMYFQKEDGTLHIVRQRSSGRLEPRVTVIMRSAE